MYFYSFFFSEDELMNFQNVLLLNFYQQKIVVSFTHDKRDLMTLNCNEKCTLSLGKILLLFGGCLKPSYYLLLGPLSCRVTF